jgi:hypothetical protein
MSSWARAETKLNLLRRVAVFPIAESSSSMSEDAWWKIRELMTLDKKYLVASKRFMINRGVFQARKVLKPADAIILGKILDADVLLTSWVEERTLKMAAYEGESGYKLWQGTLDFHPAIPINDQIIKLSVRLAGQFSLAFPYQGFQVIDELVGKAVYEREGKKFAQVYIGANHKLAIGDKSQWITVKGEAEEGLLSSDPKITVIAEGIVRKVIDDTVEIEVLKMTSLDELKENSLVRFPSEVTRLNETIVSGDRVANLSAEYLSKDLRDTSELSQETHPTTTALAFIINLGAMVLLAF